MAQQLRLETLIAGDELAMAGALTLPRPPLTRP